MRLETIPLILGLLIGLVGIGLILDAWLKDDIVITTERRRRPRRERDRLGEALVGLGVLAMAAAFLGRDSWRYSTIAVIAGSVLLLWGAKRNAAYLRGALSRQQQPRDFAPGPRRLR
jgi:hypothetical protein